MTIYLNSERFLDSWNITFNKQNFFGEIEKFIWNWDDVENKLNLR